MIRKNNKGIVKPSGKPTNFNSRKFKRALKRVEKEIEEINRGMKIDTLRLFDRFTI